MKRKVWGRRILTGAQKLVIFRHHIFHHLLDLTRRIDADGNNRIDADGHKRITADSEY